MRLPKLLFWVDSPHPLLDVFTGIAEVPLPGVALASFFVVRQHLISLVASPIQTYPVFGEQFLLLVSRQCAAHLEGFGNVRDRCPEEPAEATIELEVRLLALVLNILPSVCRVLEVSVEEKLLRLLIRVVRELMVLLYAAYTLPLFRSAAGPHSVATLLVLDYEMARVELAAVIVDVFSMSID